MPELQLREAKVPVPYRVNDEGRVSFATDLVPTLEVAVKYADDTGIHEHAMKLRSPTVRDIIISNKQASKAYTRNLEPDMYDFTVMKWMMSAISDNPIPNDKVKKVYKDDLEFLIELLVGNRNIRTKGKPFEATTEDPEGLKGTQGSIFVKRHTFEEDMFAKQVSGNVEGENHHEYQVHLALTCFRFLDKDNRLVPMKSPDEVYNMPWVSYFPALSQAFGQGMWRSFQEILETTHIEAGGGHEPFRDVPREAN